MVGEAQCFHDARIDTLDSPSREHKNGGSRKVTIMTWETPSFVEINMSAEIGGYQSDFGDRDPMDPVAAPAESADSE
jgi:hypothetical protein